jgi:hypothetical protein
MTESREESESRRLRELEGKNVQHYAVLLRAWIETRMERDRTLVALSSAGIGLLVTILTTVGAPRAWMLFLYLGSFFGFLATIWASIRIYQLNSDKLELEIRGTESPGYKPINLAPYDRFSVGAFLFGVVFAISIGLSAATLSRISAKEQAVPVERQHAPAEEIRSLQGIENLRPSDQPAPQQTPPVAPPATQPDSVVPSSSAPATSAEQG